MKKMMMLLALAAPLAFAAPFNSQTSSYGIWESKEQDKSVKITAQGMDGIYNAPKKCRQKGLWGHEAKWITGKSLRAGIQESIELAAQYNAEDKNYAKEMAPALAKIKDARKYWTITGFLSCADGASTFIQLDNKMALEILSAPDNFYTVLYKK